MSSLEKFAKSQCPNLSKIHSCGNQVKAFPILNFGMLAILWLHMNKMEDISNLEKSVLPKLELLKLNENRIKGALPPIDFPKLQKLELQQNSIEDCSVISTWKVPIIREINLKQNNLRGDLPRLPFPTLKKLYL
jgi:Leucine-rich repeat (LRR) protein